MYLHGENASRKFDIWVFLLNVYYRLLHQNWILETAAVKNSEHYLFHFLNSYKVHYLTTIHPSTRQILFCICRFLMMAKTKPPLFLPTWGACTRPVSACSRQWRVLHSGSSLCEDLSPLPGLCWSHSWCGPKAPPRHHWDGAATAGLVNRQIHQQIYKII